MKAATLEIHTGYFVGSGEGVSISIGKGTIKGAITRPVLKSKIHKNLFFFSVEEKDHINPSMILIIVVKIFYSICSLGVQKVIHMKLNCYLKKIIFFEKAYCLQYLTASA